jgi:2-dehydro-3-deoxygluconokinase
MKIVKIGCAGEVMVELAARGSTSGGVSGDYRQGLAGDSFNTAIYLARAGLAVDYLTRLGDDRFSDAIMAQLQAESIGGEYVSRASGRQPGLYLIHNDDAGERQFSYWRDQSPARQLFDQPMVLPDWDAFYFTGVTLAVTRSGFDNLLALLVQFREKGRRIMFDPNYRPQLWQDREQAQHFYRAVLPYCDTVLPTLDDDQALWDIDSVAQCRQWYLGQGVEELVIKAPALVCHVYWQDQHVERQAKAVKVADATGAGDSFNAGYLAARLSGESIDRAIEQGQQLAARVVQHQGAVLPLRPAN